MTNITPIVGVGVLIRKDGKVLLGKRKNSLGNGTRSIPGGKLEFGETIEDCAIRETQEETGITIKNPTYCTYTNDIFFEENKHCVTLYVLGDYDQGELQNLEPDKCAYRERFTREHLPTPLFLPLQNLLAQGFHPYNV